MKNKFRLESLLNRRLLIVSGKGGVGKTTLSLVLGLIAAQHGKKVIVVEVNSEEQVARLLERPPIGYRETELLPRLSGINIHPKKSFEEYVLMQIKFRSLYKAVFGNRLVRYFIEATPGLSDLMSIGKIYALTNLYDVVIVDAPASGHSIALLEIPSVATNAVRIGPLKTEAAKIDLLLHDSEKTEVVLVTLPEEMPVTEAVEMRKKLEETLRLPVGSIFLNQVHHNPFAENEKNELLRLRKRVGDDHPIWKIIELQNARAALAEEYTDRLKQSMEGKSIVPIPFIYSPNFGLAEIQSIASDLENFGKGRK